MSKDIKKRSQLENGNKIMAYAKMIDGSGEYANYIRELAQNCVRGDRDGIFGNAEFNEQFFQIRKEETLKFFPSFIRFVRNYTRTQISIDVGNFRLKEYGFSGVGGGYIYQRKKHQQRNFSNEEYELVESFNGPGRDSLAAGRRFAKLITQKRRSKLVTQLLEKVKKTYS